MARQYQRGPLSSAPETARLNARVASGSVIAPMISAASSAPPIAPQSQRLDIRARSAVIR